MSQRWRPNVKKVTSLTTEKELTPKWVIISKVLMLISVIIHPSTLLYLSSDKVDNILVMFIPLLLNPESWIFSLSYWASSFHGFLLCSFLIIASSSVLYGCTAIISTTVCQYRLCRYDVPLYLVPWLPGTYL